MKYYRTYDYLTTGGVEVITSEFEVIRHTPKGVWIDCYNSPRFVLTSARKRFACPSVEEAMESFMARKKRQLSILRNQTKKVEQAIEIARRIKPGVAA